MSCGLAVAAMLMLSDPNVALAVAQPPVASVAPIGVADEPLFADIVARSTALKGAIGGFDATSDFATGADFLGFKAQAADLAAMNMQAHLVLKARGTDDDLKCILRGISEDLPIKVAAVEGAITSAARGLALSDLAYLLNDNAEVITAPPQPTN